MSGVQATVLDRDVTSVRVEPAPVLRRTRRIRTGLAALLVLLAAWALAALLRLPIGDEDGPVEWLRSLTGSIQRGIPVPSGPMAWLGLGVMVLLGTLHFGLATVVLRAAAGGRTVPLRSGFLAQLAAAAANRLTPLGLGGAAVNARFLFLRGVPVSGAAATVASVSVLGVVADVLFAVQLWVVGGTLGVPGSRGELTRLAHDAMAVASGIAADPRWLAALLVVALGLVVAVRRRRRPDRAPGQESSLRTAWRHALALRRRPLDLAVLLLASAGTTAVLALAMVVSVRTVGAGTAGAGAVVMAYLVGAAAGNAVPVPAGIASTEAALAAGLVTAGVSAVHAVSAVILYRVVTFWAPVPVGVVAARWLRRRRLL